jgi:Ser/Thr protein kinase RdoA (MazF antagonist)
VTPELASVLGAWGLEAFEVTVERAASGLIQETWFVDAPGQERLVIQRLHPIFAEPVLEDLEAVTEHLAARGLPTPRLVRTLGGERGTLDVAGKLWRALTWLDGHTVDRVRDAAMAREAGALVARFHRAVADCRHEFRFVRAGVHDTAAHLARLEGVAGAGGDEARALAGRILDAGRRLELDAFADLPRRVTHGDLKVSNVLFRGDAAHALLDLDTLGRLPLPIELGDALRSWCNPLGEDVAATRFDLEIFTAAIAGYAAAGRPAREEAERLVAGLETVCVELAARFCVDAVEDRYFGWDAARFPSRRAHNLVRAAGQLALAEEVARARADAEGIVARFLHSPGA